MSSFYRLTTLVIFLFLCVQGNAQDLVYRNYSIDDGLPSSEVYHCMQDAEGYMWFATDHGVCRYDGRTFRTFTTIDGLQDNVVFKIVKDYKNRLWFIPQKNGLCYYEHGRITPYEHNRLLKELIYKNNNLLTDLHIDNANNLWFTVRNSIDTLDNSLFYINSQGDLVKINTNYNKYDFHYYFLKEFPSGSVGSMFLLHSPNKSKKTDPIRYSYNKKIQLHTFSRFDFDGMVKYFLSDSLVLISYTNKASIHNIDIITKHNGRTKNYKNDKMISCLYLKDQKLYIGTESGLKIINYTSDSLIPKTTFLENSFITCITTDHENNLWISTLNKGIFCIYNNNIYNVTTLKHSGQSISFLKKSNNYIYFGTSDQKIYKIIDLRVQLLADFSNTKRLIRRNISDIAFIKNNEIFVSNFSIINPTSSIHRKVKSLEEYSTKKHFFIKKLILIGDDTLLCCLNTGFALLVNNKIIFNSLSINFTKKITQACYNNIEKAIYLGTLEGIYRFKLNDNSLQIINLFNSIDKSSALTITDICLDNRRLFIGTKEAGLLIYNYTTNRLETKIWGQIGTPTINCILQSPNHHLWIGTNNGLFEIILKLSQKPSVIRYTKDDGLPSNEITHLLFDESYLYVACKNNIYCMPSHGIYKVKNWAPFYIDTIVTSRNSYSLVTKKIFLNSDENNVLIKTRSIFYRGNKEGRICYQLERNKDIIIPFTNIADENIRLLNLRYGDYALTIKSINKDGIVSKPKLIFFAIKKRFTETSIFNIIICIIGIGTIVLFVMIYLRIQSYKEARNRLILISEQKALRAQMNPHFLFNALNSIQYFISRNDPNAGMNFLAKFSKLVRSILENSSKGYVTLKEEIDNLNLYLELEKLRFEDDFEVRLSTHIHTDASNIKIPSMMIQPFIENSLWHGLLPKDGEKKINIVLEEFSDRLHCTILDNGIGREASMRMNSLKRIGHQSKGLTNIEERIKLFNAAFKANMTLEINDLTSEDESCSGTEVLLVIPLIHYKP